MAVDRGELRYKIAVEDQFTKPIQQFRTELLKAKNTLDFVKDSTSGFRNLTRDVASATTEMRRFRGASSQGSSEEAAANRETQKRLREIAALQKQRTANERLRADILRAQRQEAEKLAAAERKAAQEIEKAQQRATVATRSTAAATRDLNKQLLGTENNVNRVAFTFRRLFGILAAFAIARQAVSGFTNLVSGAIQFNRTVEDSQVGLASLFVSAGQITDEWGNIVTGAQAFTVAQREAQIQSQKLRQDALLTTATYEELLVAFQAAIGPGLAAGLNPDQVRKVAINISQAAAAFGLEQNQLAEEVRSLITGTGQLRTTRLAQVISNEDIRKAREAGTLFELLTSRLEPFALAAEVTQKNFSGLLARISDAAGLASGKAGFLFFIELKSLLKDIGDAFIVIKRDAKGAVESVTPDPKAVATLAILFNGLRDAVAILRSGLSSLNLTEVQNALALVAVTFKGLAQVAIGFIQGLIGGLSDVAVIAKKLFGDLDTSGLQEATKLVIRIGVLLVAAALSAGALVGSLKLMLLPLTSIASLLIGASKAALTLGSAVAKIPLPILAAAAAVIVLGVALKEIMSNVLDVELGFSDLPEVIGAVVEQVAAKFFGFVEGLGTLVSVRIRQALVKFVSEASAAFSTVKALILDAFSAVGSSDAARAAAEAEQAAVNKRVAAARELKALELELAEARKVGAQVSADADKRAGDRIQALRNAIEKAKGDDNGIPINVDLSPAQSSLTSFLADMNAKLSGLIGGNVVDTEAIKEEIDKLFQEFEKRFGNVAGKPQDELANLTANSFGQLIQSSQQYIDILTNMVRGFASFASDAIVDAFDPTKDVDIRERFARLLQDIARQVLQMIFSLLVATAIAKAFGVPLASPPQEKIPTLPTFGLAEGGPVPGSAAVSGPRPAGIPASDTVPAWLTPGEFVQTVDAVRRYGSDVMEAIRQGSIDPLSLRALAGLEGRRNVRRSTARSGALAFAEGGLVPQASVQRASMDAATDTGGSAAPPIALVVGNEQSLDRLLAGGKRAMLDFMRSNAGAIDGILSKNRI